MKAKPKPASTALARRPPAPITITLKDPKNRLAPVSPDLNVLGEEAALGALGLVEIKLTKEEEHELSQPVLESEVLIKPTGQAYLSHPSYTRWFNRAFGRLGWSIAPRSKPLKQGSSVIVPYVLYIHGQPAAFAYGEQDYFESNKDQSYGDVIESTVASALRRCAKRLGVGLELWDKRWLDSFIGREGLRVKCDVRGEAKWQWRRKSDPPFWNELRGKAAAAATDPEPAQRRAPPPKPPEDYVPPTQDDPDGDRPISNEPKRKPGGRLGQVQRLWVICKNSGRDVADVKQWLFDTYGYQSSKDIKRKHYEAICAAIESKAPLPAPGRGRPAEREPGEEG